MILGEISINHFRINALVFVLLMSYTKCQVHHQTIHNNNKKTLATFHVL